MYVKASGVFRLAEDRSWSGHAQDTVDVSPKFADIFLRFSLEARETTAPWTACRCRWSASSVDRESTTHVTSNSSVSSSRVRDASDHA